MRERLDSPLAQKRLPSSWARGLLTLTGGDSSLWVSLILSCPPTMHICFGVPHPHHTYSDLSSLRELMKLGRGWGEVSGRS